jgi:hypothetical protein
MSLKLLVLLDRKKNIIEIINCGESNKIGKNQPLKKTFFSI